MFGLKRLVLGLVVVGALVASGCQPVQPVAPAEEGEAQTSEIPVITIHTTDYTFTGPEELPAGRVTIKMINDGPQPHHIQLLRLNDGVTMDQFMAALQVSEFEALPLVSFEGGPGVVPAGGEQTVMMDIPAGQYLLTCFVADQTDGLPHMAHGMMQPIVVTGDAPATAADPASDAEIEMKDFAFTAPDKVAAGHHTWKVNNTGKQPHEMSLIKLAEGKTMADVMAFMQAPEGMPPFVEAGGLQAINPGATAWMDLDLTPGTYVAVCFVPDPASEAPHLALGMMRPILVE
jgi:hypothetical protein